MSIREFFNWKYITLFLLVIGVGAGVWLLGGRLFFGSRAGAVKRDAVIIGWGPNKKTLVVTMPSPNTQKVGFAKLLIHLDRVDPSFSMNVLSAGYKKIRERWIDATTYEISVGWAPQFEPKTEGTPQLILGVVSSNTDVKLEYSVTGSQIVGQLPSEVYATEDRIRPPLSCESFKNISLNNCNSTDKWNLRGSDCKTDKVNLVSRPIVDVNMNVPGADPSDTVVSFYESPLGKFDTYCDQITDEIFAGEKTYKTIFSNRTFRWGKDVDEDPGRRKLCVHIVRKSDGAEAKCGGAIEILSSAYTRPTPTITPTALPIPVRSIRSGESCSNLFKRDCTPNNGCSWAENWKSCSGLDKDKCSQTRGCTPNNRAQCNMNECPPGCAGRFAYCSGAAGCNNFNINNCEINGCKWNPITCTGTYNRYVGCTGSYDAGSCSSVPVVLPTNTPVPVEPPPYVPVPTAAPQPLSCTSWVDAYLTRTDSMGVRGDCSGWGVFTPLPHPDKCKTSSSEVTLHLGASLVNAQVGFYQPPSFSTYCTDVSDSLFTDIGPYVPSKTIFLTSGNGDKKVCVRAFDPNDANRTVKCGAGIERY